MAPSSFSLRKSMQKAMRPGEKIFLTLMSRFGAIFFLHLPSSLKFSISCIIASHVVASLCVNMARNVLPELYLPVELFQVHNSSLPCPPVHISAFVTIPRLVHLFVHLPVELFHVCHISPPCPLIGPYNCISVCRTLSRG